MRCQIREWNPSNLGKPWSICKLTYFGKFLLMIDSSELQIPLFIYLAWNNVHAPNEVSQLVNTTIYYLLVLVECLLAYRPRKIISMWIASKYFEIYFYILLIFLKIRIHDKGRQVGKCILTAAAKVNLFEQGLAGMMSAMDDQITSVIDALKVLDISCTLWMA